MSNVEIFPPPKPDGFDFDNFLYPAQAFDHPMDVVRDTDLTVREKRAILASWASDAQAIEFEPALRRGFHNITAVTIDEILVALRRLDEQETKTAKWARRKTRQVPALSFAKKRKDQQWRLPGN